MTTFVDTNVLVYAKDAAQPTKQPVAAEWLERLWMTRSGRLSTQVLTEYYVTVTRKLSPGMSPREAHADVQDLATWRPVSVTPELMSAAWDIEDRLSISFWDALIVAAAKAAGCSRLLTEDLQDGQHFDGLTVVNPFRHPHAEFDDLA